MESAGRAFALVNGKQERLIRFEGHYFDQRLKEPLRWLAFISWRDALWAYAYAELRKVAQHERPQPSVDDFLKELPAMVWPS